MKTSSLTWRRRTLQPLLENSPSDLEIYSNLAQVYTETRRFGDAEKAVRSAEKLAQNPSDKETVGFLLGGMYERQKKYEQAEQAFKGVLAHQSSKRAGAQLFRLYARRSRRAAG